MNGDKQWVSCHNYSKQDISKWLNLLRTQSGNTTGFRLRKLQHTDHPSIQGPWTPYTFKDPAENLAEYPNTELSKPKIQLKTATDELLEIFNSVQISDKKGVE